MYAVDVEDLLTLGLQKLVMNNFLPSLQVVGVRVVSRPGNLVRKKSYFFWSYGGQSSVVSKASSKDFQLGKAEGVMDFHDRMSESS